MQDSTEEELKDLGRLLRLLLASLYRSKERSARVAEFPAMAVEPLLKHVEPTSRMRRSYEDKNENTL